MTLLLALLRAFSLFAKTTEFRGVRTTRGGALCGGHSTCQQLPGHRGGPARRPALLAFWHIAEVEEVLCEESCGELLLLH